jgi:hypothetical protein
MKKTLAPALLALPLFVIGCGGSQSAYVAPSTTTSNPPAAPSPQQSGNFTLTVNTTSGYDPGYGEVVADWANSNGSIQIPVTVAGVDGFAGTVYVSASDLPPGAAISNPNKFGFPIDGTGSYSTQQLTLSVPGVAPGTYGLQFTATTAAANGATPNGAPAITHTQAVNLVVLSAASSEWR